jgi:hypothetical protein
MVHVSRSLSVARWLVPMLTVFLVLGHACELPALADLVSHTTEDAHHSAGDHADENLISCDAVGVPSSTGYLQLGPSLDVAEVLPVASLVPVRVISSSRDGSSRLPSRPPLFLLHASLLI